MLNKLKKAVNRNKRIITNFSYLSVLQLFNILSPLIAYPFLIKVLGTETYGLVIFSQAVVGYLVILVAFGFNITATKKVSIHRDDKNKLSEIISSVLIVKTALLVISFLIMSGMLIYIEQAKNYETLFFLTMWMVLYDVIFPQWYFQGIEKMKYITYITLVSRVTFLGFIFVIIKSADDYLYYPIINGIGALISGIISLYIIFWKHKIKFNYQPINKLKFYLKDALTIFISTVSINLYKSTNKVVVGAFLGMGEVAYYDLAEKIINIAKIPQNILSQTIFPKISSDRNISFVKKIFNISILFNILLYIVIVILAEPVVLFLGGVQMLPAVIVIYILGFTVPILALGNIFGFQSLVAFGYVKEFTKVVLIAGVLYFTQLLSLWLTLGFTIISISIINVSTEILTTIYLFIICKKRKVW
jgi:O-antigen/teichoic acid export membrane protein